MRVIFFIWQLFLFQAFASSGSSYSRPSSRPAARPAPRPASPPPAARSSRSSVSAPSTRSSRRSSPSVSAPSSNYQRPSTPSVSAPPVQSSGPIHYDPVQKSEATLKSHLYSLPREGITINNISLSGDTFEVKGVYKDKFSLQQFVEQIKGEGGIDRQVKVKKKSTFFAGERTRTYKINAINLWQ